MTTKHFRSLKTQAKPFSATFQLCEIAAVFNVWESESSLCTRPASSAFGFSPAMAIIFRHLPIKAAHCSCFSSFWFSVRQSEEGSSPFIRAFSCQYPRMTQFFMLWGDCSSATCGQLWDETQLCNFDLYSFHFYCLSLTGWEILNCFAVSFSGRELGNGPEAKLHCQHVSVLVLCTQKRLLIVKSVLLKDETSNLIKTVVLWEYKLVQEGRKIWDTLLGKVVFPKSEHTAVYQYLILLCEKVQ